MSFKASLVVVAAGQGSRLKKSLKFEDAPRKAFFEVAGRTVLEWTLSRLRQVSCVDEIVVVLHADDLGDDDLCSRVKAAGASKLVVGGARRQDSCLNGLRACSAEPGRLVGVHDAARLLVHPQDVEAAFNQAFQVGPVILGGAVSSTVKEVTTDESGHSFIVATHDRDKLRLAQTPQIAERELLIRALSQDIAVTDEAMALESLGERVRVVCAKYQNPKLTTASDLEFIRDRLVAEVGLAGGAAVEKKSRQSRWRVGEGNDIHRLVESRPLMLGGIEVPYELGAAGHSDADVVLHAVVDALLGAIGEGDIGELFPDTDPAHKNQQSSVFVAEACRRVYRAGYEVANVDITIHAERPKLKNFKARIRDSVSGMLNQGQQTEAVVNIKAKTNEGVDALGEGRAIAARVTLLLVRPD